MSKKKKSAYNNLQNNLNFEVDIRSFKKKTIKCKNDDCQYSKKGFSIRVQAEVDVSIVMKVMQHVFQNGDAV